MWAQIDKMVDIVVDLNLIAIKRSKYRPPIVLINTIIVSGERKQRESTWFPKGLTQFITLLPFSPPPPAASRSPGRSRSGHWPGGRQHRHGSAPLVLRSRPPGAGPLPGLHAGGALCGAGSRRRAGGGAFRRHCGVWGGGTSGRPGDVRPVLWLHAEGACVSSSCSNADDLHLYD